MEGMGSLLPFLVMIAILYFFMIAPQMRKAKQEKKFANELKKGDRVVTKSGMHGKILDMNDKDHSCIIETMAGKIKFNRSAISMEMSKTINKNSSESSK